MSTARSFNALPNEPLSYSRGLFVIEGVRNFIQAVDHRLSVATLLYSEKLLINPIARKLVRRLKRAGVPFARVTPEQFRRVSRTERASGVAAILHQQLRRLDQVNLADVGCLTALSHMYEVFRAAPYTM
jgi:TrmH family RNA methyltransferase